MSETKSNGMLSKIREYNKVTFYNNGHPIFSANTSGGISLPLGFKVDSNARDGKSGMFISAFENIAMLSNYTPQLDYIRWRAYRGTDSLALKIPCTLEVETSYKSDIVEPILRILKYCLPSRADKNDKKAVKVIESLNSLIKVTKESMGAKADKIFALTLPKSVNPDRNEKLSMVYGPLYIEDIIITSFDVDLGPLILYATFGGDGKQFVPAPEIVNCTIGVETLRIITTNLMNEILDPYYNSSHDEYGNTKSQEPKKEGDSNKGSSSPIFRKAE